MGWDEAKTTEAHRGKDPRRAEGHRVLGLILHPIVYVAYLSLRATCGHALRSSCERVVAQAEAYELHN